MTNRRNSVARALGAGLTGLALVGVAAMPAALSGCKQKKVVKAPPPPPPPPPRKPDPVDSEALVQQMGAEDRVQFPRERAPISEALARAVISFADALAGNDTAALRAMLDEAGRGVIDDLSTTGDWDAGVSRIEFVRVVHVEGADREEERPHAEVTFAIQEPGEAYLLRWSATPAGEGYVFGPLESAGDVKPRASAFDGQSGVVVLASLPGLPGLPGGPGSPDAPAPGDSPTAPTRPDNVVPSPSGPIHVPGPGSPGGG